MKIEKLLLCLLMAGSVFLWATTPSKSEEVSVQPDEQFEAIEQISRKRKRESSQKTPETIVQAPTSGETEVVQITGVQVNVTDNGLEIVLETPKGEQLQVVPKGDGNTYIGEIPNAQLSLPSGNTFRQEKPFAGIKEITATNLDAKTIRVTVIGESNVPQVELFDADEGLVLGVTPVASSTQTQQQPQTPPADGTVVIVTGVTLNPTENGLEIILETKQGESLQVSPQINGLTYIGDLPNAQLRLPSGETFRQANPFAGIIEVTTTNLNANTIRVTVIGEANVPSVELFDGDEGLVLGVTPVASSTQTQQQPPTSPTDGTVVIVTKVSLNPTEKGLEIILETKQGERLQVSPQINGLTYIGDLSNAQLRLPSGETFRQENPFAGIIEVTATNLNANIIRVTVTGEANVPSVELFDGEEGLVLVATSTQPSASDDESIELVVTGSQNTYNASEATTGTRTDTPIRDIPQAIQVVPQQVLEDQQVNRLDEAVRNVSGVSSGDNFGNTRDGFVIRGFSTNFGRNVLIDGFATNGFTGGFNETANLERVEVLKGPASVLFGNLEPGGVINLITKKPLLEPFYSGAIEIGNYDFYQPSIDISGPLNEEKTLLYRLNTLYQNSGTFRQFDQGIERFFIAPVISLQLGQRTDLTFDFNYLYDERPFDRGLIAFEDGVAAIPFNRILGEPDDISRLEQIGIRYRLEHRFSDNWKIRNAFQFLSSDPFDYRADPLELDESTGDLARNFRSNNDIAKKYALQTDLAGKFTTGSIQHSLVMGFDLSRQDFEGTQKRFPAGLTPDINIFNPVYGVIPRPALSELTTVVRDNNQVTDTLGIFVQDLISLSDNFKLLLGGRFDIVDQEAEDKADATTSFQYVDAFTPRVGIVYQPIPPISLYASYSRSFQPNLAIRSDGSFLEPERGTQYEVGIKGEFLDGRVSATLAAYQITKSNVATIDPANTDFSIAVGEQRSRGIELDIAGEILPGWNLIGSYAYTDAIVTESSEIEATEGNRLSNIPDNAASLWTTYEIQSGGLQGLGFGVGVFFVDDRLGDLENTFKIPSYVRTDAAIFYRRENWKASLNFKNLFDVNYIRSTENFREAVTPGETFTVVGSISVNF